jgi:GTPase SAR1 family protein
MGCGGSKKSARPVVIDQDQGYDYRIQFLLLGPQSVGKTAIMTRFIENKFSSEGEKCCLMIQFKMLFFCGSGDGVLEVNQIILPFPLSPISFRANNNKICANA